MNTKNTFIRLSGDQLKIIAVILMFIDHASYGLLHNYLSLHYMDLLPETYTRINKIYEVCRGLGSLAFPIFCFFLVEGFIYTHNIKKYVFRLAAFALISELPFNLGLYRKVQYVDHQNVMVTLLLGLLALILIRFLQNLQGLSTQLKWFCIICAIIAFSDLSIILNVDHSYKGILTIVTLYLLRDLKPVNLLAGAACFSIKKYAPASFLLLYFYDADKKRKLKYFFYIFYPAHLLLIYLLGSLLLR